LADAAAEIALDTVNECLWRGSRRIALTPKAFALLAYLAERPRRLVTKDELLDALWKGTSVTDGVLKVCVRELRIALDDDAKTPRFIETLHRRGMISLVCAIAAGNVARGFAEKSGRPVDEVRDEVKANLVPGAILVPSGIYALIRAQNAGCAYMQGT